MTKKHPGMLIGDAELRERYGARADAIIAELDKDKATMGYQPFWNGGRNRHAVEKRLAEIGAVEHRSKSA